MYNIPFYKLNPSGNTTLLFHGLHYEKHCKNIFASKGLMDLSAEQAGFMDINSGELQMAGGEFCINATRCLALLMAFAKTNQEELEIIENPDRFIKPNPKLIEHSGTIITSGFNAPLSFEVTKLDNFNYDVALNVPLNDSATFTKLDTGIVLVNLPGISHILIDECTMPFNKNTWQQDSAHLRSKYNLENEAAVGTIWWKTLENNSKNSTEHCLNIEPIVFVKQPLALHYENACGSGTLALGLWLYNITKHENFHVKQPGGYLKLKIQEDAQGLKGLVAGPVSLIASGTAYFANN